MTINPINTNKLLCMALWLAGINEKKGGPYSKQETIKTQ